MRLSTRLLVLISVIVVAFTLFFYLFRFSIGNLGENVAENTPEEGQVTQPEGEAISGLVCGTDETGMLTDVIFLGVYDVDRKEINLLQIPRDSYIGEAYKSGKINAVYGQYMNHDEGIDALEEIIEEQFKVPIDYTAVISLEAFRNIIDGLGGVRMVVDRQIEYTTGKVLYEGEQVLTGEQCEWIVRFRKGYPTGDVGRMEQQRKFLSALINTVREQGRIKAVALLVENYSQIKTDMPKSKAISIANKVFLEVPDSNIHVHTVKGDGVYNGSYAVYQLDAEDLAHVLNTGFRPYSDKISAMELDVAKVPNPVYPEYNTNNNNNNWQTPSEQTPPEEVPEEEQLEEQLPLEAEGIQEEEQIESQIERERSQIQNEDLEQPKEDSEITKGGRR